MIFHVITLFPQMFESTLATSILARAQKNKRLIINFVNPRNFTYDKHKTVDDKPYGGGAGMILKVDVVVASIESIKPKPYVILLSASGKKFDQKMARNLSKKSKIALICGHYEGVDARVENFVDEVVSIGDFILTGGEIAALAIIDSVTRLIPGVIREESTTTESFNNPSSFRSLAPRSGAGILHPSLQLEFPQYTRPEEFRGLRVPKILLTGNHKDIESWRQKESLKRTKKYRPDLLKSFG